MSIDRFTAFTSAVVAISTTVFCALVLKSQIRSIDSQEINIQFEIGQLEPKFFNKPASRLNSYDLIAQKSLFNEDRCNSLNETESIKPKDNMVRDQQRFNLQGIIKNEKGLFAVFQMNHANQMKILKLGEMLDDWTLMMIYDSNVILRHKSGIISQLTLRSQQAATASA